MPIYAAGVQGQRGASKRETINAKKQRISEEGVIVHSEGPANSTGAGSSTDPLLQAEDKETSDSERSSSSSSSRSKKHKKHKTHKKHHGKKHKKHKKESIKDKAAREKRDRQAEKDKEKDFLLKQKFARAVQDALDGAVLAIHSVTSQPNYNGLPASILNSTNSTQSNLEKIVKDVEAVLNGDTERSITDVAALKDAKIIAADVKRRVGVVTQMLAMVQRFPG